VRIGWRLPAGATASAAFALIAIFGSVSASAQVTPADVEAARERVRRVSAELEDEVAAYDAAVVRQIELEGRIEALEEDLSSRERELALARHAVRARIADMYMSAGIDRSRAALGVEIEQAPALIAYLDTVAEADREAVNRLETARRDYLRQQGLLEDALAVQEDTNQQMESLIDSIYTRLDEANAEYQAVKAEWDLQEAERIRREEEERIRRERELFLSTSTTTTVPTTPTTQGGGAGTTTPTTAPPVTVPPPPPSPPGTRVCPVDGAATFRDSWGEPRPGGRGHTGVDMMAPIGTPIVAIEAGVIWSPSWHYAGGIGLYLVGESGDTWYYAHMDGYAPGIQGGTNVVPGQLIGYVGNTGNASVPHLHLGWLVGGTTYTNPYPVVAGVC
jgi:murein DD-endopeptidase MepM/ murein hydrolase activator NlpD